MTPARKRTLVHDRITAQEFITIWQQSNSLAEVAKKAKCRKGAAKLRAFRYRKLGIPLKDFPPLQSWEELAVYAQSLMTNASGT